MLFFALLCLVAAKPDVKRNNVIFILTDDLDKEMDGMKPLEKTRKLIGSQGVTFENAFVTTPVCCPSRSTILTGRYQHNTRVLNNTIAGNCSSPQWQETMEPLSVGVQAQDLGYKTFYAGKYLNQYGFKAAGGPEHVPKGWDEWLGLIGNSRYFNYSLSRNGKEEKHGDSFEKDYLTDLLSNESVSFINENAKEAKQQPFFMMIATPAPHEPWTYKPEYANLYSNVSAPRNNGQWDVHRKDAHWVVRNAPSPMSNVSVNWADNAFRSRWRALKSVDDLVENIYNTLAANKLLDSTYIIFSSDHGYHTGQFSLPYDKRHMYEFDIRVPLLVRGPEIVPGSKILHPVAAVDFAPSLIDLMNPMRFQEIEKTFDGQSFVPLVNALGNLEKPDIVWRENILIEYHGEGRVSNKGCPDLGPGVSECVPDCVCEDAWNNTYTCVREMTFKNETIFKNLIYCEFVDSENFVEVYDMTQDPKQLKNIRTSMDPQILESLNMKLIQLSQCQGKDCLVDDWRSDPNFSRHFPSWLESENSVFSQL